jgi:hypothetical protein
MESDTKVVCGFCPLMNCSFTIHWDRLDPENKDKAVNVIERVKRMQGECIRSEIEARRGLNALCNR